MIEQAIKDRYFELLKAYLTKQEEKQLVAAAEFGREMVLAEIPPEEVAELHEETLRRLAGESSDIIPLEKVIPASALVVEIFMAYSLTFQAQNEELQREITARKRVEENLKRWQFVVESAKDAIYFKDLKSRYIIANDKTLEAFGLSREEVIVKNDYELMSNKEEAKKNVEDDQRVIQTGRSTEIVKHMTSADGKEYWFQAIKVPYFDAAGNITGVAGVARDITKRKQVEQALMASLKEKEVLLREIHHRVKNNMQLICSLINLQTDYMQNETDIQILRGFQDRLRSMRLIHEKFYQSSDLTHIGFDAYVQDLLEALSQVYAVDKAKIAFQVNVKDSSLGIDTAIPLGLIINELVSNSLKHAFPEGKEGEIEIALHPRGKGKLELVVSDNGVGIPKDLDFRDTESLGLRLVTILVEDQLHGNIELDRTEGTKFIIRVKVK